MVQESIKEKLELIPEAPGIYKMLDAKGTIIYIGKSKCLKQRVKSYFIDCPKWDKAKTMASFIYDIEYQVTDTHLEALLLECELIKKHKPYFNVIMKYDTHYVYIRIKQRFTAKPIIVEYVRENDSFGPFRSKSMIFKLTEHLRKLYPITKTKNCFRFEYHLFPAIMNKTEFETNSQALTCLCTSSKARHTFIKELEQQMKFYAKENKYETAAFYRDFLVQFDYFSKRLDSYQSLITDVILLNITQQKGCKLFLIAHGQVIHKEIFMDLTDSDKEDFIRRSRTMYQTMNVDWDAIECIDYRDIIYKELKEMDPCAIEHLSYSEFVTSL